MSAYTGYLIRRERLAQNLSQEGLCRGICAVSYLSKIESGSAQPGAEIIDRLFAALGIEFVRDEALIVQAQRALAQFFFHMDAGEPFAAQKAFFAQHGEALARSEFALQLSLYELVSQAHDCPREKTEERLAHMAPFMDSLSPREQQWVLLVRAEFEKRQEDEGAALEQASRLGAYSLITYKQAAFAYQRGWYSWCMELGERAYTQAAEEGSAATMIWSAYLLGSCACNRQDMALAERYYDRVLALCRGYRTDMSDYIRYNLGSTYLEMGEDAQALEALEQTREIADDAFHNAMLHQKLAILCARRGSRVQGNAHLERAKAHFAHADWSKDRSGMMLVEKMLRFAQLLLEGCPMDNPAFEQVTRALYDGVTERFSFGFKRFYGTYLIEILRRQRRYKEALTVREEMDTR